MKLTTTLGIRASPGEDSKVGGDYSLLETLSTRGNPMALEGDHFERLEKLVYRPVSTRPDWLKAWRNEANYLLYLARRASDDDDLELLQELEDQAREMADVLEGRWRAEGL